MWEDNGHLQPPATTQLVGLQSLVRFREESPTGVPGIEERIRGGFEQTADFNVFDNQEALHAANVSPLSIRLVVYVVGR